MCIESVSCCSTAWCWESSLDEGDMDDFIIDITSNEILWAMQTIIRHASDFSACIYLGANIFYYFLLYARDVGMDDLFSTFFSEALQSLMAYTLFCGMAHAFHYGKLRRTCYPQYICGLYIWRYEIYMSTRSPPSY